MGFEKKDRRFFLAGSLFLPQQYWGAAWLRGSRGKLEWRCSNGEGKRGGKEIKFLKRGCCAVEKWSKNETGVLRRRSRCGSASSSTEAQRKCAACYCRVWKGQGFNTNSFSLCFPFIIPPDLQITETDYLHRHSKILCIPVKRFCLLRGSEA